MGIIRKQSTASTIIIYLGIVIGFFGAAVLRPKILSPDEIGFLQVLLNMTIFIGAVLTLGANLIIIKMLPTFKTENNENRGLFKLVVYIGLVGSLIGIPLIYFTESLFLQNNEGQRFEGISYDFLFYLTIYLVIVVRTFSNLFDNYLRSNYVTLPGVISDSIVLKSLPIIILGIFYVGLINYSNLVYLNLFIHIIPLFIGIYFLNKIAVIHWSKPGPFSSAEKKQMFGISTVGFMEIISYFLVLFIDVFMLKRLMNDEAVGIYTTMFFFGAVISIPLKALIRIAHPIISEAFAKNDMSTIQQIYQKSSKILFLLGALVFLLVWGNRYSIENFLDPVYAQGIWVIFFIGMAHLMDVLSSVNYQIISITPHYRFNLYMGVFTIVLLITTNYIFIHFYGIVGVAIGSMISMFLVNFSRYLFLFLKYKLSPFSSKTIRNVLLFVLMLSALEIIPNLENLYINAIIRTIGVVLFYIPSAYFLKCSEDFNQVIEKYLSLLMSIRKK